MEKAALLPLNHSGDIINLNQPIFTIGRALNNSFIITNISVSRCHCVLEYTDNNWTIKNRSSNKTFVNGQEISNNTYFILSNNDIIKLSFFVSYKFVFPFQENIRIITPNKKRKIDKSIKTQDESSSHENSLILKGKICEKDKPPISQEPSTSLTEVQILKAELNREKLISNELKEENKKFELQLLEKEADLMDKLANTVKLEEEIQELKANCATLEKEKEELQLQLTDFECQTTLLKLRIENLSDITNNKTLTQNIVENNISETTENITEDDSDMQILQSVLKAEILDKELLIKEKLCNTIDIVKTIRPVKPVKNNKQDSIHTITTNLVQLQADIEELNSKRKELENNINLSSELQNKFKHETSIEIYTQSKEEFKQVLQNQEDAISEMKDAFKADFLLKFYNSLELDLQCLICHELFIKATCVDCGHIFCRKCIFTWNRQKKSCPTCRKPIKSMLHCITIDSYIDQCYDLLFPDKKEARQSIKDIHEADASTSKTPNNGRRVNNRSITTILLSSEESSDSNTTENDSDFDDDDYFDEDQFYHRPRYGVCFVCGDPNHWANQCPRRRNRR